MLVIAIVVHLSLNFDGVEPREIDHETADDGCGENCIVAPRARRLLLQRPAPGGGFWNSAAP